MLIYILIHFPKEANNIYKAHYVEGVGVKKKIKAIQTIISREKRTVSDFGIRRSPTSTISYHDNEKKLTLRMTMCILTKNCMEK